MFHNDEIRLKGKISVRVYDKNGNLKRYNEPRLLSVLPENIKDFLRNRFKLPVGLMVVTNHNIVTDEGDALIADILQDTPTQTKVDGTNGYIEVGTGFTSESKAATSCTTPTGSPELLDAGYPATVGAFGAANDNQTEYVATFEAGDLTATGIDEAALINGAVATAADCLAYAQISPAVNVTASDTLEITWTLTFTGS